MEARKNIPPSSIPSREHPQPEVQIRTEADARRMLSALFDDERELASTATEFFKLGRSIAGRAADQEERDALYHKYYEQMLRHPMAGDGSPGSGRAAVIETLEEMRAENLRRHSTFEAHRAHVEIESFSDTSDDFRALYNPPEDRTRAEHAEHLNAISQTARDAYERGATVYGDVLVIPRESIGKPTNADQIRAGSHAHAVREFTPLVGEERANEVAVEFVELSRAIAGRTSDGDTRLVVFQTFYNEIKLDASTSKIRSLGQQSAQVEPTLERMRVLARAMRAEEWKRDRGEFVEIAELEGDGEARQRDAEHEAHGLLTYRIDNISGLEPEHDDLEATARERVEDEREEIGGRVSSVEYERIRLASVPPRLPDGLTEEEERRLRYEIIPSVDRRLESGVPPRDIAGWLSALQRSEERRARDEKVARTLTGRMPAADRERPLTRVEELRALYALRSLTAESKAAEFDGHRAKIDEEISRIAPTERERAEAIDTLGARLALGYRAETARLKAFAAAEAERDRLEDEALKYGSSVRASAEFELLLQEAREQDGEHSLIEREALLRPVDARHPAGHDKEESRVVSNHPELVGAPPVLSTYAELRQAHEQMRRSARAMLAEKLINPDIERAREASLAEIERHQDYYRRLTRREISSVEEARTALALQLDRARATLAHLNEQRAQIKIEPHRTQEEVKHFIFVRLGANASLRLPVGSVNEYKTLAGLARKLNLNPCVYESWHGREITGEQQERAAAFDFARAYVSYRFQDETTRLRNEKRLFRDYGARLDGARSTEELLQTINAIRRDNYARSAQPERFAEERSAEASRGEQARRPLTSAEMRHLFLSPAPEHHTAEMRELRMSRAVSGRDRQERIRNLERGQRVPSPELATLLREFERTRHDSPDRHSRNIRAFLGDYLNPPAPERNRFSPENLYELGRRIQPAERDYFFRVVDSTKRAVTAGVPMREIAPGGRQEVRSKEIGARSYQPTGASAKEATLAGVPRDSISFRLYYGAATWREAGQLSAAPHRNAEEKPFSRERQTVMRGIQDHDLETAATLLTEFSSKPDRIEAAARFLRSSPEPERRQLGDIIQTFREMKVSRDPKDGQLRFQITTPANSELGRADWTRLLDHLPPLVNSMRGTRLTEAQRGEITREALDLAWQDVEAVGRQYAHPSLDGQPSGEADDLHRAVKRGSEAQKRARIGSDGLGRSLAAHTERAARALEREGLLPEDLSTVRNLTRIALDPRRSQDYAHHLETQTSEPQRDGTDGVREQFAIISSAFTARDQESHARLTAYGARTKAEYFEGFNRIDEELGALSRSTQKERAGDRKEAFSRIRGQMETKVAAYLTEVVSAKGLHSLEREAALHAEAVSRVIKETFQEHGYDAATLNLDDDRLNTVTAKLVEELPAAIRAGHERAQAHAREHQLGEIARRDVLSVNRENVVAVHAYSAPLTESLQHSASNQQAAVGYLHQPDDEIVEQKVTRSIGQIQERALSVAPPSPSLESHQPQYKAAARELNADHREQFTPRHILTR